MPKTEKETHLLYNDTVAIHFYPNSHIYKKDDDKSALLGVTTILGIRDKSAPLIKWATGLMAEELEARLRTNKKLTLKDIADVQDIYNIKKEEAADIGTQIHAWCELYVKGGHTLDSPPEMPEDPRVKAGATAFLGWVKDYQVKIISAEKVIYSQKYGYVGTTDCEFTMGIENHKIRHVGDYKSSNGIYDTMAFQVSAYQQALEEEFGYEYGDKWILRFQKEDKYDKKTGELLCEAGEFEPRAFPKEDHRDHFRAFLAALELTKQTRSYDKKYGWGAIRKY